MAAGDFPQDKRNTVKRVARRGSYDRATIYDIIDRSFIVHVAIGTSEVGEPNGDQNSDPNIGPAIIPMFHARIDDEVIFHGATTSRLMRYLASGSPVCISATLVDGIVLARSLFHHSMNYRSVVAFGSGRLITKPAEVLCALQAMSDKLVPGRWQDARKPNPQELKATSVVAVKMESASAKVRTGGPVDDAEDMDLPVWAGVLPIHTQYGIPQADGEWNGALEMPAYITTLCNRARTEIGNE